eukprot:GHVH01016463.1.p1 GENE.GHVH01016463.1~~GHVH01016463.1.p1  ORF type:complete len:405 (+),score=67.75 GHVH01016463.1:43-1257(+)
MATLASSFLADLAGLESEEEEDQSLEGQGGGKDGVKIEPMEVQRPSLLIDPVLDACLRYIETVTKESKFLLSDLTLREETIRLRKLAVEFTPKVLDLVAEKDILSRCSNMILKLDQEIVNVARFVSDIYGSQFPELSSIVPSPADYIELVRRAEYEMDFTKIDLTDLIPSQIQVAVNVAASMATGESLDFSEMSKVQRACKEGTDLMELREIVLNYIESRMGYIAPNVSVVIGKTLGARLMTLAEGLRNLATVPSQNLILLGTEKRINNTGGALTSAMMHKGILAQCDLFVNTPPAYQTRAMRLISGKISLAARVDLIGSAKDGSSGQLFREQIIKSLQKSQTAPPAALRKPLPKPKEGGGKTTKRGGRRVRKLKEKLGQSRLAKEHNRMRFGVDADRDELVSD